MSKHHTARLVGIRLNQMCHQRRGQIIYRFNLNALIRQRLETTPDDINNRDLRLSKRALRRRDGKL